MPAFFLSLSDHGGSDPHNSLEAAVMPIRHVAGERVAVQTLSTGACTVQFCGLPEDIHFPGDRSQEPGVAVAGRVNPAAVRRLLPALQKAAHRDLSAAPPLALVAEAWATWGERTLDRLEGDFGLAVLDLDQGRTWVASDRFAVVPLHYTHSPGELFLSNILHSVVRASNATDSLDDDALADFLLFGHSRDHAATIYTGIRRLPPATLLRWQGDARAMTTWWSVPVSPEEPIAPDEVVAAEFRQRLEQAVETARDRRATCVLTSSGLDSTSLAALSAELSRQQAGCGPTLLATIASPEHPELSEFDLSARFAQSVGLEHLRLPDPPGSLLERPEAPAWPSPEPCWHQWNRVMQPGLERIADRVSLAMTGQGGDLVLYPNADFFLRQLKHGQLSRAIREWIKFRRTQPRRPPLGIKTAIWGTQRFEEIPAIPRWFRNDFASATSLEERFSKFVQSMKTGPGEGPGYRNQAVHQLSDPYLGFVLGGHAPSTIGAKLEITHPFLATDVLDFALGLRSPSLLYGKRILRLAMQSLLPDFIRTQSKRLIAPDVRRHMILATSDQTWREAARDLERFDSVIDPKRLLAVGLERHQLNSTEAELLKLPLVLRNWHATCHSVRPSA